VGSAARAVPGVPFREHHGPFALILWLSGLSRRATGSRHFRAGHGPPAEQGTLFPGMNPALEGRLRGPVRESASASGPSAREDAHRPEEASGHQVRKGSADPFRCPRSSRLPQCLPRPRPIRDPISSSAKSEVQREAVGPVTAEPCSMHARPDSRRVFDACETIQPGRRTPPPRSH